MCFVNQSICSGCTTVTETPALRIPGAPTPDVLQQGCNGKKVLVKVEHTGPEFCLNCYDNELSKIQNKWEKREEYSVTDAKKQGYTSAQIDAIKSDVEQEMQDEIMKLNQEWEKMWYA